MLDQMQGFRTAVNSENWKRAVEIGRVLVRTRNCTVEVLQNYCLALEHTGRWLELAPVAELGVRACDAAGIEDERLGALLKSLGRGLYDRQRYLEAKLAYDRSLILAEREGWEREIWRARYSIACCLERLGPGWWPLAVSEYRLAATELPDWYEKLAATSNWSHLLHRMGHNDEAHDVATSAILICPSEHRKGAAWADLLRVLAHLEVEKGRPDVALLTVVDAIETTPDNRPGVLSLAHAVRAFAEARLGNHAEAEAAIELAWSIAELAPSAKACEILRGIESVLREEGVVK